MTQTLYRFFDGDTLLYVGISINAYHRARVHQNSAVWWDEVTHVTFEKFDTRETCNEIRVIFGQGWCNPPIGLLE